MIMGNSKLVELLLVYIFDPSFLSEAEKKKMISELRSVWDMQESEDVMIPYFALRRHTQTRYLRKIIGAF